MESAVKWSYISLLCPLLVAFFAIRVLHDVHTGAAFPMILDIAVGILTLAFFTAYAITAVRFDHKK